MVTDGSVVTNPACIPDTKVCFVDWTGTLVMVTGTIITCEGWLITTEGRVMTNEARKTESHPCQVIIDDCEIVKLNLHHQNIFFRCNLMIIIHIMYILKYGCFLVLSYLNYLNGMVF